MTRVGRASCHSVLSLNRQIHQESVYRLTTTTVFSLVEITATTATAKALLSAISKVPAIAVVDSVPHFGYFPGYTSIFVMVDKDMEPHTGSVLSMMLISPTQVMEFVTAMALFEHSAVKDCKPIRHLATEVMLGPKDGQQ
jgi:hypothetical protein